MIVFLLPNKNCNPFFLQYLIATVVKKPQEIPCPHFSKDRLRTSKLIARACLFAYLLICLFGDKRALCALSALRAARSGGAVAQKPPAQP